MNGLACWLAMAGPFMARIALGGTEGMPAVYMRIRGGVRQRLGEALSSSSLDSVQSRCVFIFGSCATVAIDWSIDRLTGWLDDWVRMTDGGLGVDLVEGSIGCTLLKAVRASCILTCAFLLLPGADLVALSLANCTWLGRGWAFGAHGAFRPSSDHILI